MGVLKSKTVKSKRVNKPLIFGIILFFLSIGGYTFAAASKPLPQVDPVLAGLPVVAGQEVTLSWPSGQGVIGTLDGGVLVASSQNEQIKPIASMTKLITALAVLEKQPIATGEQGKVYTITEADIASYQDYVARLGSVMPVRTGQQITQYQALQALLLPSANNIADTLAVAEFGSVEAYVTYANAMLSRYGLTKTTVADASGFSPLTISAPSDMFEIGKKALSNPVITEIVAQKQAEIPGSGLIKNTNQLLADRNVIGLKTGTTDEAGSCLLFAFNYTLEDGTTETIIGTVMGVPNWPQLYREVRSLIESSKQNFSERQAVAKDTIVGSYTAPWGVSADIVVSEKLNVYGWVGQEEAVSIQAESVQLPLTAGTTVGSVDSDGEQAALKVSRKIESPSIWWKLAHYW